MAGMSVWGELRGMDKDLRQQGVWQGEGQSSSHPVGVVVGVIVAQHWGAEEEGIDGAVEVGNVRMVQVVAIQEMVKHH